jgi:SAM-dependent methyltransferase
MRSVLDAGCGVGALRAPFAKCWPTATYTGLERSEYLCARYGWTQGSVVDFAPERRYDLVVCYDVLQYLDDRAAAKALANLGRLARVAVYLSALTSEDWREHCDQRLTDGDVHLRPADWYRRRLARQFRFIGCGVWVRRGIEAYQWELERPAPPVIRARGSSRRAPDAGVRRRRSRPADR